MNPKSNMQQLAGMCLLLLILLNILFFKSFWSDRHVLASNDGPYGAISAANQKMPDQLYSHWNDLNWVGGRELEPPMSVSNSFRMLVWNLDTPRAVVINCLVVALLWLLASKNRGRSFDQVVLNATTVAAGTLGVCMIAALIVHACNSDFNIDWVIPLGAGGLFAAIAIYLALTPPPD